MFRLLFLRPRSSRQADLSILPDRHLVRLVLALPIAILAQIVPLVEVGLTT